MKQALAYFLTALVLFQSFGRELLVVNYELNKAAITARYCVNKARPALRCNGKCYFAKQLRQAEGRDRKMPAGSVAKVKFEGMPTTTRVSLREPRRWPQAACSYAALASVRYADAPAAGVFRPPLPQV